MDGKDPFRLESKALAEQTRAAVDESPEFSISHHRMLRMYWAFMLSDCRPKGGGDVDWDEVRTILWDNFPVAVLMDEKFRNAVWSIFVDCMGAKEGMRGADIVFACW